MKPFDAIGNKELGGSRHRNRSTKRIRRKSLRRRNYHKSVSRKRIFRR